MEFAVRRFKLNGQRVHAVRTTCANDTDNRRLILRAATEFLARHAPSNRVVVVTDAVDGYAFVSEFRLVQRERDALVQAVS